MANFYDRYATMQDLDAAYDVEGSVANMAAYGERFVRDSESAREDLERRLGVRYGPTLMENLGQSAMRSRSRSKLASAHCF
jgi:hypothetical protein